MSALQCPARCGSTSFRAYRRAAILQDVEVRHGEVVVVDAMAEGGGQLTLTCTECGRSWRSRSENPDVRSLATFVQGGSQ